MTVFKLRFRMNGRQRVKYLGVDARFANQVEQELGQLQQKRHDDRQLKRLNREASELLRSCKLYLEPLINAVGLRFHGLAIRQPIRRRP